MSFRFTWPEFDAAFISKASKELENALNRGKKPSNICDLIRVKELHMGTQPPDLDILEIGEVSMDRFRGIFKLAYSGDGYLVLETKVQVKSGYNANPLNFSNYTARGETVSDSSGPSSPFQPSNPTILAADCPLIVPMQLKISLMRLRAILVLIVSRTTGVTLSFKTDPLESVLVSSTFDSLPSVRRHLQSEIENRLRDLFQKELPAMIHLLSKEWLKGKGIHEDVGSCSFALPESVSSFFPAPNRTISPPSVGGKHSRQASRKSSSIAAQSAPAELAKPNQNGNPQSPKVLPSFTSEIGIERIIESPTDSLGVFALVPDKSVDTSGIPQVFDFIIRGGHASCYSDLALPVDQYYFRSGRSIIVRAPTDLALPDPILIDNGRFFRKKSINVAKLFRSLFRISEIEEEEGDENDKKDSGLKLIEGIGLGMMSSSGLNSVVISSSMSIIPDNCSTRSRTRSMLIDHQLIGRAALSTISGNRLFTTKYCGMQLHITSSTSHRHFHHDRYSEADPDLVQFEPDEFRSSDYFRAPLPRNENKKRIRNNAKVTVHVHDTLAVKFGIMRRLQSTLAPNNFVESNILYRTMSKSKK